MLSELLAFTVIGLVIGSAYAIAASGLVITYATSNVFNMAHGSVGMLMAFVYWEFAEHRGLPTLLALVLVVGVIAPLFGAGIERLMMRRMTAATTTVSLTVTVGLLVALIGVAQALFPPEGRAVDPFFAGRGLQLGQVRVSTHEIITFVIAMAVAGGLYWLLVRTRTGTAMRAIVDNRELLALHGARPNRLGMLSWAIGSALGALAGILLAPQVQLDYLTLTLLVINAYAAAMVGRLKNLPRTIVGALILGLLQSYFLFVVGRLPAAVTDAVIQLGQVSLSVESLLSGLRAALPTLFLFAVMLLLPLERLRVGQVAGAAQVRVPSWRRVAISGGALVLVVAILTTVLSRQLTAVLGQGLATGLIMLSLVLLTGYGGDVSLGQMAFAGLGALLVGSELYLGPTLTLWSILAAGLVAGLLGAVVAIPALRLRGLYLGLGTLAFAYAMDKLLFENGDIGFALGGSLLVERPVVLGLSLESEGAFTIVVAVAFALLGALVIWVRRGRFGRLVLATRDSPAACGTLGLNITRTRVALFAMSSAMAGIAGGLYAGMFQSVGAPEFAMFRSLPLLLLTVVGGITSVTGAAIGGLALAFTPTLQAAFPALGGAVFLLIGAAAIALGREPNGLAGMLFKLGARLDRGRPRTLAPAEPPALAEPAREEVPAVAAP